MKIRNASLIISLVIGALLGNLNAAELGLTATPSFVTISGKKYAIIKLGSVVTFSTAPTASATFNWTFTNGSPGSGNGTGPFDVTYSSTAAQGIANDVIFTSTRSITGSNGNPITCTTTNKTTADVLVAKFEFSNTQSVTSSGVNNYIITGTKVLSGKIKMSTDAKITLGVSGIAIGTLSSAEDSNATFSPTSGTSDPFTTAFSSTDNTDQISMQFIPSSSASVVSGKRNMTPAVYQNSFHITGYFTPNEDSYSGTSTTSTTLDTGTSPHVHHYVITSSVSAKSGFLQAVAIEGEGYLHDGTHVHATNVTESGTNNPTIIDSSIVTDTTVPKASDGSNLVANTSCAVVRNGTENGNPHYQRIPEAASITVLGRGNRSAVDTVSGEETGGDYHIDLYCGTDKTTANNIDEDDNVILNSY